MNGKTWRFYWSLIAGILITLIGIAHETAAPMIYKRFGEMLPPDKVMQLAYFFLVMGLFVIFSGLLTVYASFGLRRTEQWARTIIVWTGVFNVAAGIGGLRVGFKNPLIYFWILVALSNTILALICGSKAKEASQG